MTMTILWTVAGGMMGWLYPEMKLLGSTRSIKVPVMMNVYGAFVFGVVGYTIGAKLLPLLTLLGA